MISLDARNAPLLLAILLLAAGVVWRQQTLQPGRDDCARPEVLRQADRMQASESASEQPNMLKANVIQWSEGTVLRAPHDARSPRFRIIRSFDFEGFYFAPENIFFANPFPDDVTTLRQGQANGREFSYYTRLDTSEQKANLTSYMYVFDGEPVTHPLTASLRSIPAQVKTGTRPLTVFLLDSSSELEDQAALLRASATWLGAALYHYDTACSEDGDR